MLTAPSSSRVLDRAWVSSRWSYTRRHSSKASSPPSPASRPRLRSERSKQQRRRPKRAKARGGLRQRQRRRPVRTRRRPFHNRCVSWSRSSDLTLVLDLPRSRSGSFHPCHPPCSPRACMTDTVCSARHRAPQPPRSPEGKGPSAKSLAKELEGLRHHGSILAAFELAPAMRSSKKLVVNAQGLKANHVACSKWEAVPNARTRDGCSWHATIPLIFLLPSRSIFLHLLTSHDVSLSSDRAQSRWTHTSASIAN